MYISLLIGIFGCKNTISLLLMNSKQYEDRVADPPKTTRHSTIIDSENNFQQNTHSNTRLITEILDMKLGRQSINRKLDIFTKINFAKTFLLLEYYEKLFLFPLYNHFYISPLDNEKADCMINILKFIMRNKFKLYFCKELHYMFQSRNINSEIMLKALDTIEDSGFTLWNNYSKCEIDDIIYNTKNNIKKINRPLDISIDSNFYFKDISKVEENFKKIESTYISKLQLCILAFMSCSNDYLLKNQSSNCDGVLLNISKKKPCSMI